MEEYFVTSKLSATPEGSQVIHVPEMNCPREYLQTTLMIARKSIESLFLKVKRALFCWRFFKDLACSAGVFSWGDRVTVTILLPPLEAMLDGGDGGGPPSALFPYSLSCLITHPLGRTFFLSPVFHCMKNSIWRLTFLRCEHSLEEISPALQAIKDCENIFLDRKCCSMPDRDRDSRANRW